MAIRLSDADLKLAVRLTPLVSIDLIIRNRADKVLLGLRVNEPGKGYYFVPGGRIWKDERIPEAFARILRTETNYDCPFESARHVGAFEHLYDSNRFADPGYGTHYVVLCYAITVETDREPKVDAQHTEYVWWDEPALLASDRVHVNTKLFFRPPP